MLASSKVSNATGQQPPLMLLNSSGIASYAASPIAVSTTDLQSLKAIPSERIGNNGTGTVYLVNSGPQPPNLDPEKFLPSNWQLAKKISLDSMPASNTAEKIGSTGGEKQEDTAACFVRMQIASTVTEGVAELSHRVSILRTDSIHPEAKS
jgi:hypothetical protein